MSERETALALRERLAELAHEQWVGWMRYVWRRCEHRPSPDGPLMVVPSAWARRWERQMDTPYAKLSQREQDSDRHEADRMLAVMMKFLAVELTQKTAEIEMLRGVGCLEDGDGPCGVCIKCLRLRAERAEARATP